jgi:hypothetical protein
MCSRLTPSRLNISLCAPARSPLWMLQQARNLLMKIDDRDRQVRFLIHDCDTTFSCLRRPPGAENIKLIRSPVQRRTRRPHGALGRERPPRVSRLVNVAAACLRSSSTRFAVVRRSSNWTRTFWVSPFARTACAPGIDARSCRTSCSPAAHACGRQTRTRPLATWTTRSSAEALMVSGPTGRARAQRSG